MLTRQCWYRFDQALHRPAQSYAVLKGMGRRLPAWRCWPTADTRCRDPRTPQCGFGTSRPATSCAASKVMRMGLLVWRSFPPGCGLYPDPTTGLYGCGILKLAPSCAVSRDIEIQSPV